MPTIHIEDIEYGTLKAFLKDNIKFKDDSQRYTFYKKIKNDVNGEDFTVQLAYIASTKCFANYHDALCDIQKLKRENEQMKKELKGSDHCEHMKLCKMYSDLQKENEKLKRQTKPNLRKFRTELFEVQINELNEDIMQLRRENETLKQNQYDKLNNIKNILKVNIPKTIFPEPIVIQQKKSMFVKIKDKFKIDS